MNTFRNIRPGEAIPRIIVDYALVHFCMVIAAVGSIVYQVHSGNGVNAQELAHRLVHYYIAPFMILSFIFPFTYLLHGFYTNYRGYSSRYKRLMVLQGAITAVLLFVVGNYLFFTRDLPARTVIVLFGVLVPLVGIGARELKNAIVTHVSAPLEHGVEVSGPKDHILVVGGAGYIGSILVRDLLNNGHQVRVLDSMVYGYQSLEPILSHPRLQITVGDCRHIQSVVKGAQGITSIVHLAAIVGDPACEQDHRTAMEVNYAATRMLVEIAKGNGVQHLVFASSCSVYGESECVCDEQTEPFPLSLYAATKINSERVLLESRSDSFHPTILRLATVFGDSYRPRFDLVVNLLTAKAKQEGIITIYNGTQWRPFVHVRDVARAITTVLHAPTPVVSGQMFNVGDARLNYTLDQVAECIRREFPRTRVEHVDNQDRRNYRVSFEKIKNRLGFHCTYTLEKGIQQLKTFLEEAAEIDYKDTRYSNVRFLEVVGSPAYEDSIDGRVMAAFAEETNKGAYTMVHARQMANPLSVKV